MRQTNVQLYILGTALLFLLLLVSGCNKPLSTDTGNVAGRVVIANEEDNSGIKVTIYHQANIDTTLARLKTAYDSLGVDIDQRTEFDHRLSTPIAVTQTNASGDFSFSDLPVGIYNIVCQKEGFGYHYIYDVSISNGDNQLSTNTGDTEITLYPETTLTGNIATDLTMLSDHHYIVQDARFMDNTHVIIQPGAVIRIEPLSYLKFRGNVTIQGNTEHRILFTSNDQMIPATGRVSRTVNTFNEVRLEETATVNDGLISYCVFSHGETGLQISGVSCHVRDCAFHSTGKALAADMLPAGSIEIRRCLFANTGESENYTVNLSQVLTVIVERNVFLDDKLALHVTRYCLNGSIKNNYFDNPVYYHNSYAMYLDFECHPNIVHNYVTGYNTGLYMHSVVQNCNFDVKYNVFHTPVGIHIHVENYHNLTPMRYNNFLCKGFGDLTAYALQYLARDSAVLDAKQNYWSYTSNEEIAVLVDDYNDHLNDPAYATCNVVDYSNFSYLPYNTAGVER